MIQVIYRRAFKASKHIAWVAAAIAVVGCNGGSGSTAAGAGAGASQQSASSTLLISGTPPAQAVASQLYSFSPSVTAPAGSVVSFSISNKPSWATFSTVNGSLSGTPLATDAGIDGNIVISVSNAQRTAALAAFAITVSAGAPSLPSSASAGGASLMFSYPHGFAGAGSAIHLAWSPTYSGSNILLTAAANGAHQAGGAYYATQENISAFTTDFTFQIHPGGFGVTFVIQNSGATTNPGNGGGLNSSGTANGLGYFSYAGEGTTSQYQEPIYKSIAIKFDTTAYNSSAYVGSTPSSTGLYINAGPWINDGIDPEIDLAAQGINLGAGDVMEVHIVYDGSILTMVLTDTVTGVSRRMSWPVDIPAIVGGNLAWAGFTGGTVTAANQTINTWEWWQGYNTRLSTPTFSIPSGQYGAPQTVSIGGPAGATIYYTTDGTEPTTASAVYRGPITVNSSKIVQAIAVESNYTDSLVGVANYQIGAEIAPIDFSSGFAGSSGLVSLVAAATLNRSSIQLTDTAHDREVGAAWYLAPVDVSSFTTSFTLQFPTVQSGVIGGTTFTIQNQAPIAVDSTQTVVTGGPYNAAGQDNYMGYGGYFAGTLESVAIKFEPSNNSTGVFTDGASPAGSSTTMTGINLASGHPMNVQLTYSGTTLTYSITDSVTGVNFTTNFTIDIPSTVGADTAYVGFTASTGYASGQASVQDVTAWTYHN